MFTCFGCRNPQTPIPTPQQGEFLGHNVIMSAGGTAPDFNLDEEGRRIVECDGDGKIHDRRKNACVEASTVG